MAEICGALHIDIPGDHVVWDLPKYFVAFGMIMTLFENQTEILQVEIAVCKRAEETAQTANEAKGIPRSDSRRRWTTSVQGRLQRDGQRRRPRYPWHLWYPWYPWCRRRLQSADTSAIQMSYDCQKREGGFVCRRQQHHRHRTPCPSGSPS